MAEEIKILKAERDGEYGLRVEFSDGTEDAFSAEELTALRPHRPDIQEPESSCFELSICY